MHQKQISHAVAGTFLNKFNPLWQLPCTEVDSNHYP